MKEYNVSSYKGKQIKKQALRYEGYCLSHIYTKFSANKKIAYDWCYNEYIETENHAAFSICSHNSFGFTCSWVGTKDGEDILRYETKDNSYLVWLER